MIASRSDAMISSPVFESVNVTRKPSSAVVSTRATLLTPAKRTSVDCWRLLVLISDASSGAKSTPKPFHRSARYCFHQAGTRSLGGGLDLSQHRLRVDCFRKQSYALTV